MSSSAESASDFAGMPNGYGIYSIYGENKFIESWNRQFDANNKTSSFCTENAFGEHYLTASSDINSMFNSCYRQYQQQSNSLTPYYNTGSSAEGHQLKQTTATLNNARSGNEPQQLISRGPADDVGLLKVVPRTSATVSIRDKFRTSRDVSSSGTMNFTSGITAPLTGSDVITNVPNPISPAQRQGSLLDGVTGSTVIYPWMKRRHNSAG